LFGVVRPSTALGPQHSDATALANPAIQHVCSLISMIEQAEHSRAFPNLLLADVEIRFKDGTILQGTTNRHIQKLQP